VVQRATLATASLRTPQAYIAALRRFYSLHKADAPDAASASAFAEQWKPLFGIVEVGSNVAPSARIHDSVVLAGARVERDATVVRSVVCPGARVPVGATVVDQIVAGSIDG
jgi:ADP-glucose pyrophosphorylase